MTSYRSAKGFTLIELIIVIVLVGIIATVVSPIVGNQFQAYTDSSRRATLVQEAQSVMQRLELDLYNAIPNSTEIDYNGADLTLLAMTRRASDESGTQAAGRYDETTLNDPVLTVFGCLIDRDGQLLVVGSQVAEDTLDDYEGNRSGPVFPIENGGIDADCSAPPTTTIELAAGASIDDEFESFNKRAYLTEGKVEYLCRDNGQGGQELIRRTDFGPNANTDQRVASRLSNDGCNLEFIPGTTLTAPGLQVDITISQDGEQVQLIRIFQLQNAP